MREDSHIIPTVFASNLNEFRGRFSKLAEIAKRIQIDFMDGKFVPKKSVKINEIPMLKEYNNIFEAHLMVENPQKLIEKCSDKGFRKVIFHIESAANTAGAEKIIEKIKELNMGCFVAINPDTPLKRVYPLLSESKVDGILVMGVKPGREGQVLDLRAIERIKKIKRINEKMPVQIDGGINGETIADVVRAGADLINSGSFVSGVESPFDALELLERKFEEARRYR